MGSPTHPWAQADSSVNEPMNHAADYFELDLTSRAFHKSLLGTGFIPQHHCRGIACQVGHDRAEVVVMILVPAGRQCQASPTVEVAMSRS
jgi:hypothetical protein